MLKRLPLLAGLLLFSFVMTAAAAPPPTRDLAGLAAHYPANTGLFMAVRTDDEMIDTLDMLYAQLEAAVISLDGPVASPASFSAQTSSTPVHDALDELSRETFGGSFDVMIRPWLGDTAALGIMDWNVVAEVGVFDNADQVLVDGTFPYLLAVELADADLAFEQIGGLFSMLTSDGTLTEISAGDYRYYRLRDAVAGVLLTPEALLFGTPNEVLNAIDAPPPTLLDTPDFLDTLDKLPEDAYSGLFYIDYSQMTDAIVYAAELDPFTDEFTDEQLEFFDPFFDAIGGVAFGFTMFEGDTLVMDYVQTGSYDALQALGYETALPFRIDPAFANRLPTDTALVVMQGDLKSLYEATLANMRLFIDAQDALGVPPEEQISEIDLNGALFLVEFGLRSTGGLELQEDLLAWMDSDYALMMAFSDDLIGVRRPEELTAFPVEFGLAFDVSSDPEAATRAVTGLARAVDNLVEQFAEDIQDAEVRITQAIEQVAGRDVLLVTVFDETGALPFPLEFLAGANDEVLAIGTPGMVRAALTGDGGFANTATFSEVEDGVLVDEAGLLLLADAENLLPIADLYRLSDPRAPWIEEDVALIRAALGLLRHATISGSNAEDGTSIARATISLNLDGE